MKKNILEKRQEKAVNLIAKFESEELIWALGYIWAKLGVVPDEEFGKLRFNIPKETIRECLFLITSPIGRMLGNKEEPTFKVGNEVLKSNEVEIKIVKKKN